MEKKLDISHIKNLIEKIIDGKVDGIPAINRSSLYNNGAIYYMNGNDGTDFDYQCNNRACEFYVFWKNEDGAIKVLVGREIIEVFIYNEQEPFNCEKMLTYSESSPFDLEEICCYLQGTFDKHDIWDKEVTDWQLTEYQLISTGYGEEDW